MFITRKNRIEKIAKKWSYHNIYKQCKLDFDYGIMEMFFLKTKKRNYLGK